MFLEYTCGMEVVDRQDERSGSVALAFLSLHFEYVPKHRRAILWIAAALSLNYPPLLTRGLLTRLFVANNHTLD
jgi:hypothetical protein